MVARERERERERQRQRDRERERQRETEREREGLPNINIMFRAFISLFLPSSRKTRAE